MKEMDYLEFIYIDINVDIFTQPDIVITYFTFSRKTTTGTSKWRRAKRSS
jgi:hypothetical protein